MTDLRVRAIRLAHTNPELRPHLLPLVSKVGMEFPTEDARKKYLEDHPGADKSKHSVKNTTDDKDEKDEKKDKKKDDTKGKGKSHIIRDEEHGVDLDGVTKEDFNKWLNHPEGKELLEKWNLKLIAGRDGVITRDDLDRAVTVRRKLKAAHTAQEEYDEAAAKAKAEGKPKPKKPNDDVCQVTPKVCAKNLGIERSSMPQLSPPGKNVKQMRAACPDSKYKKIKDDIAERGARVAIDALSKDDQENYYTRENAEAAVLAGADPESDKGTFDTFIDRLTKKGVKIEDLTKKGVKVKELHATQAEIRASKALDNADKYLQGRMTDEKGDLKSKPGDVIYVSSDGHILDGHHRWSGLLLADPDARIPVIRIGMTMKELLHESFETPGVFRQDFNFKVVPEDNPIDLARKPGETWKQRNNKWYGKTKDKVGGPFESKESAENFASGKKDEKSKKEGGLRASVIRLAAAHPEFRSVLLPLLG